jgi:hypothetical protein
VNSFCPSVHKTKLGVNVCFWINSCVEMNKLQGHIMGPAISDKDGFVFWMQFLDEKFHTALRAIYDMDPSLFLSDIKYWDEISKKCFTFHSFEGH